MSENSMLPEDQSDSPDGPIVTIVMPTLNEAGYVEDAITSLLPAKANNYELLVIDGGSTDRTCEIVAALAAENPRIRLLHNPKKIQSAALNVGAKVADPAARILLRTDCHAIYPDGFVQNCVSRLEETGATSVVVPMKTVGRSCFQRAIAAAQNSILGNGGAAHRRNGESKFVEHGHHAAFDRSFFLSLGGYDENFSHNEDAELDIRATKAGGRIWLEHSAAMTYFPRAAAGPLARQYFKFGQGRAATFLKHRQRLKLRQLLPLVILYGYVGAAVLATVYLPFLLIPAAYTALCFGWGVAAALSRRDVCLAALGAAAMIMHFAWAVGFTYEVARGWLFPVCGREMADVNRRFPAN